jgi:hypothetical protein
MQIFTSKIITNSDQGDFPFIEARVLFYEETIEPHLSAEVTVFLEKRAERPLSEIESAAIQKAHAFLSQIVSGH